MRSAVVNSTPIIALNSINRLDLLQHLNMKKPANKSQEEISRKLCYTEETHKKNPLSIVTAENALGYASTSFVVFAILTDKIVLQEV